MADYKKTPQNSLKSDITSNEQLVSANIMKALEKASLKEKVEVKNTQFAWDTMLGYHQ